MNVSLAFATSPDSAEYKRALALLDEREANLQQQVQAVVDAQLERLYRRSAQQLRADPAFCSEISTREKDALNYLRDEIAEERHLLALYR